MDSCINCVLSLVQGPATKIIGYVLNVGSNLSSLKEAVTQLKLTKDEIKGKMKIQADQANNEVKETDRMKNWLKDVAAKEKMEVEIETKYNQKIKLVGGCLLNCWSGYRIGRRAFKMTAEAKELDERGKNLEAVTETVVPMVEWRPPTPEVPEFERYMKQISDYIRDNKSGTVGIWGLGGVGKTLLLDKIQTSQFITGVGYQFVVRLTVSREPDTEKIKELLLERLNLLSPEQNRGSPESRAFKIERFLRDKSFLLLLDDLWSPLDLKSLGIPCLSSDNQSNLKQHVVFTCRSRAVCMKMGASLKFQVVCLEWDAAWQLFQENLREVAEIIRSKEMMQSCAKKVAEKCGGLPLALKTVAQALSSKTTLREWEDALRMLDELQLPEMWGEADSPFPLLKISYDSLRDDRMRQCFLSCALWPEGDKFNKDELILCWMGLGLLDGFNNFNQAYNKGHTIIEEFKQLCLLEQPPVWPWESTLGIQLKMHNVIRALALWIASDCGEHENKWLVRAGLALEDAPETEKWGVAEKISLLGNKIQELPQHPQCPNLTTMILRGNRDLCIPDTFVKNMPKLRYLDASFITIKVLPTEICRLTSLRYLDLSSTKIESLQKELQLMSGLEYFILRHTTSLVTIPDGLISSLTKLKLLNLLGSSCLKDSAISNMIVIELEMSKVHITLAATVFSQEDLTRISESSYVTLWKVSLESIGSRDLDLGPLLRIEKTRSCLQELKIEGGDKVCQLFMSNPLHSENALKNLDVLELWYLSQLQMITCKGLRSSEVFCNLRSVRIHNCSRLTEISWIQGLQQLEDLLVEKCWKMKHVIDDGLSPGSEISSGECVTAFPNLKSLILQHLPNLEAFYWQTLAFPCLEDLLIRDCPKLKKLPFSSQITSNKFLNVEIYGSDHWFHGLLWENGDQKSFFWKHFARKKYPSRTQIKRLIPPTHPLHQFVLAITKRSVS